MSFLVGAANRLYMTAARPARDRLARAMADPGVAQRRILQRIVRANQDTSFGRAHDFAGIRTTADFRNRVPVSDASAFADYIRRITCGEPGVLTSEPVRFVEPSGGSSGPSKYLPYTPALLREFSAATLPWVHDLLENRPALRGGRAYWAITPPARRAARTSGGIPIGLEHDSDYFPAFAGLLLDRVLGTPRALARAPGIDACRYLTLRALVALPDLSFVSVWSPSFLTLLADTLDDEFERLLHDIERGTLSVELDSSTRQALERALPPRPRLAAELRRRFGRRPPRDLGSLWPRLALISCWADGHAARSVDAVRSRFPRVEIQPKGLLATEGVISLPLFAAGGAVAAVASHFLEFAPADSPSEALTVDQLDAGATYEVIMTTGGGLYRYRLRDLVRVEGRHLATPILSFLGRTDGSSDLAGEKLTPSFVESALSGALGDCDARVPFAILAPARNGLDGYLLFIETTSPEHADRISAAVERRLRHGYHYALCRDLGQLAPVRAVTVKDGARVYERACVEHGQRAGAVKPAALETRIDWSEVFMTRHAQVA